MLCSRISILHLHPIGLPRLCHAGLLRLPTFRRRRQRRDRFVPGAQRIDVLPVQCRSFPAMLVLAFSLHGRAADCLILLGGGRSRLFDRLCADHRLQIALPARARRNSERPLRGADSHLAAMRARNGPAHQVRGLEEAQHKIDLHRIPVFAWHVHPGADPFQAESDTGRIAELKAKGGG